MQRSKDDHGFTAQTMDIPKQIPKGDFTYEPEDGTVGILRCGNVIQHQNQTAEDFDKKEKDGEKAQMEGMREACRSIRVCSWAQMKQETQEMGQIPRIWLLRRRFSAKNGSQFSKAQTGYNAPVSVA
jgi:hypothetical protein